MAKQILAIFSLLLLVGCQATSKYELPTRTTLDDSSYPVKNSSDIFILYISALDCPPCWRYKEQRYPKWIKSKEYNHVNFRELEFYFYSYTGDDDRWPLEYRWIREKTFAESGAPRWIVSVDGKIISNQRSWSKTYSLIQRLVARKLKI